MEETLLADPAKTKIFEVVLKKDDGAIGFDPVGLNSNDWAAVLVEKNGEYLMVRQLRYGLMKECEEPPSGIVETGEDPKAAAVRELEEETGIRVRPEDVVPLGRLAANPAFMNNYMHYFYVNLDAHDYETVERRLDPHEKIVSYWKDKRRAVEDNLSSGASVFFAGAILLLRMNIFENKI